jgi:hypothetical protein
MAKAKQTTKQQEHSDEPRPRRRAAERLADVTRLLERNRRSIARARKDFDIAIRKGQAERASAAKARIAKYRRLIAAKASVEAKYAVIAGLDPLGARVVEKARAAKPKPVAEPEPPKPKRKGKPAMPPTTPRPIIAAEPVPVRVPAPWAFGHVDQAEMRVTSSILGLWKRGGITSEQLRAAGWVRSIIEAAGASGVSGIDYSAIKVDTSTKAGAPMMDAVVSARDAHAAVCAALGKDLYTVVYRIAYSGCTIVQVASTWPDATVTDGQVDRRTLDHIARCLRDGLRRVAEDFCSGIDPNRQVAPNKRAGGTA